MDRTDLYESGGVGALCSEQASWEKPTQRTVEFRRINRGCLRRGVARRLPLPSTLPARHRSVQAWPGVQASTRCSCPLYTSTTIATVTDIVHGTKQTSLNQFLSLKFYVFLPCVKCGCPTSVSACDLNEESNESYFHRKINVWIDVVRNTRIMQLP